MTILDFIQQVMPRGTQVLASVEAPDWAEPPDWPPNLFAIAALLIERLDLLAAWDPAQPTNLDEVQKAARVGRAWLDVDWSTGAAGQSSPLSAVQKQGKNQLRTWWRTLCKSHGGITMNVKALDGARASGKLAAVTLLTLQLVAVADEACSWVGYSFSGALTNPDISKASAKTQKSVRWMRDLIAYQGTREGKRWKSAGGFNALGLTTLTLGLATGTPTVLPKARTPAVGCTLRALTHNLALLPPDTQVRTVWRYDPRETQCRSDHGVFNILIVPFPYQLNPRDFGRGNQIGSHAASFFTLRQSWLPGGTKAQSAKIFCDWLEGLVTIAQRGGPVHAVVFPELSLSEELFNAAADRLERLSRTSTTGGRGRKSTKESKLDIELLVAGITSGPRSNRVATRIFYPESSGITASTPPTQGKHHRWKIDRKQLMRYGLSGVLDAAENYWEDLDIGTREVHFHTFRDDSVLCCLICEDLARLDPCQPVVRAVGPNLVIALLMDGPQIKERWPARYATVLAEDPGSAVLTVSSLALMELSSRVERKPGNRFVALWKSSTEDTRSLELPPEHHALLACLRPKKMSETTLDGRDDDGTAVEWMLEAVIPVKAPNTGSRWPRC